MSENEQVSRTLWKMASSNHIQLEKAHDSCSIDDVTCHDTSFTGSDTRFPIEVAWILSNPYNWTTNNVAILFYYYTNINEIQLKCIVDIDIY
jgi:hypothetical protein